MDMEAIKKNTLRGNPADVKLRKENRHYKPKYHWQNIRDIGKNLRSRRYHGRNRYNSKENAKSEIFLTQNIQEIWHSRKSPNLRIIGIKYSEDSKLMNQKTLSTKS